MKQRLPYSALASKCRDLRRDILTTSYAAKTNHIGCNLSIVEILVSLFYTHLRLDPDNFHQRERDYFILSKGHAALSYYLILSDLGFFSKDELHGFWNQDGSRFCEHPLHTLPGVDVSTGALGHGLSIGAGIAFGLKERGHRIAVLLGDGECGTGQVWEAATFASVHSLNNLVAIVDANGWQGLGRAEELTSGRYAEKFAAFGWDCVEVEGNRIDEISEHLNSGRSHRPLAIVARTTKGKGISFMENKLEWHYKSLDNELYEKAMKELSE